MKTIKPLFFVITFSLLALNASSQEINYKSFSLGIRSTHSSFSSSGFPGNGIGGQFRIRFSEKVNTEWFADYITTNIGNLGRRVDGHVGWSVMFYPLNTEPRTYSFVPYILAGHCFDYTRVNSFNAEGTYVDRPINSAVQAGLGTHFYLSPGFDISLSSQFMSHLGKDLEAEIQEVGGVKQLNVYTNDESGLEGHVLTTLSLNVKIASFGRKKNG